jgi:hypothetical protein
MDDSNQRQRTIRELGGEIWAELGPIPEIDLRWDVRDTIVDIVMGVLARHAGAVLENDQDIPVEPWPIRPREND